MATSVVELCNLALQKLGAERITSLTQDHPNARHCNACYNTLRRRELRARAWNFAKKRTTLAPHATAPVTDFGYAFPLPVDYLRLMPPARLGLDWQIENHANRPAILTNDGDSLEIRYIADVTDPTVFDALFDEALAAKMAWHMCEAITQSNQKKADILGEYKDTLKEARQVNAFENISEEPPEDAWIAARR